MTGVSSTDDLGPIGLWSRQTEVGTASDARDLAREYERAGFEALWIPEGLGHEALTHAALLLEATDRLCVATGVANIWARDALAAHAGSRLLRDAHGDRFLLGLGVSHRLVVDSLRGHQYRSPLSAMAGYLDRLDGHDQSIGSAGPRVIAALGPRMIALAAERGVGVITFLTTPEHTADARRRLGSNFLAVQLPVVVAAPDEAKVIARDYLTTYLALENYQQSFRRLGFSDHDFVDGGSDRLIDALLIHGDVDDIRAAADERRRAGADHVALQPLDEVSLRRVLDAGATVFR